MSTQPEIKALIASLRQNLALKVSMLHQTVGFHKFMLSIKLCSLVSVHVQDKMRWWVGLGDFAEGCKTPKFGKLLLRDSKIMETCLYFLFFPLTLMKCIHDALLKQLSTH